MIKSPKCYLGDGVYIDHDGIALILTTEDGVAVTNTIYMEMSTYQNLVEYVNRLKIEKDAEDAEGLV